MCFRHKQNIGNTPSCLIIPAGHDHCLGDFSCHVSDIGELLFQGRRNRLTQGHNPKIIVREDHFFHHLLKKEEKRKSTLHRITKQYFHTLWLNAW